MGHFSQLGVLTFESKAFDEITEYIKRISLLVTCVGIGTLGFSGTAIAQTTLEASGVTAPGGTVQMGNHLWVSDHLQGFCRLDPALPVVGQTRTINPVTCLTTAGSPGQASYNSVNQYVYIPDNSSKSVGVVRARFNPVTQRLFTNADPTAVNRPRIIGGALAGSGVRVTATALRGNVLFVGAIKTGRIFRVDSPNGASPVISARGRSSDGGGVESLAIVGNRLYLAEGAGVSVIPGIVDCVAVSSCIAGNAETGVISPTALATDGTNLFIGSVNTRVYKFDFQTATQSIVAGNAGPFSSIFSLGVHQGSLYVGDDPTDGNGFAQGSIFKVAL
jgi:hypothetical protein